MNSVRLASQGEVPPGHNINTPVLIHCEGNGRSGVALVADLVFYTLDHNQVIILNHYMQYKYLITCIIGFRHS